MPQAAIDRAGLDELFAALERRGYTLVGPTVRDRAIVLEELDSTAELPAGWTDVQEGGTLPARAPRRRRAVRPQRRPELVEELPVPVRAARVDRPPGRRRRAST